jgi:outer membrane protein W
MNSQLPLLRDRLLPVFVACGLLCPALLSADTPSVDQSVSAEPDDPAAADQSPSAVIDPLHQDENHWRLRFNLSAVEPMGDSVATTFGHGGLRYELGAGAGAGLQAEYRASPRLGIEIGVMGASEFSISNSGGRGDFSITGFAPLSLGLNAHLTPGKKCDFYAGPQFALVNYGTDRSWRGLSTAGTRVSADSDWAWGLVAGLDVPLGKRGWLFNANLRYLETGVKKSWNDVHVEREFNPLIFSVGFGYAF